MHERIARLSWAFWFLASLAVCLVFALVTWQMAEGNTRSLDEECAAFCKLHAESHPWLRNTFWTLTQAGSGAALTSVALAAVVVLLVRKQFALAAIWVLAAGGGDLLNNGLKGHFNRARPEMAQRDPSVAHLHSLSYPSGHAMGSAIGLGMYVYLVLRAMRQRSSKFALAGALILLVISIGFSRIYLRAHWCSDVLGGFAMGACWLLLCLAIYERRRAVKAHRE